METDQGRCPGCDDPGSPGNACHRRACSKRGYHFIATRYWERLETDDGRLGLDRWIGQLIGEYLIVDVVGKGGFGKVYLGLQQPLLRLRGAVKILNPPPDSRQFADAILEKFTGEASALAELSHPNVVRLLKYGSHNGHPYLVMEYVDRGRTLVEEAYAREETGQSLPYEDLLHIVRQLLHGLEAAHSLQIVHRDIKPENVMIQRISGDPLHVRLLDFGMAKFVEKRNDSRWALGSPSYMAPEQLDRTNIGPWTDLFAVGVICFELFTGQRPYAGETDVEIVGQKLDPDDHPTSRLDREQYPDELLSFLTKALAHKPAERFQDTHEFWEALSAAVDQLGDETHSGYSPGVELTTLLESRDIVELDGRGQASSTDEAPPTPVVALEGDQDNSLIFYEPKLTAADRVEIGWEKLVAYVESLHLKRRAAHLWSTTQARARHWADEVGPAMRRSDRYLEGVGDDIVDSPVGRYVDALIDRVGHTDAWRRVRQTGDAIAHSQLADRLRRVAARMARSEAVHRAEDAHPWMAAVVRRPAFVPAVVIGMGAALSIAVIVAVVADDAPDSQARGPTMGATVSAAEDPTGIDMVSAGRVHTCARLNNGALRCWGANRHGELGVSTAATYGDDEPAWAAPIVPLGAASTAVATAGDLDGSVTCAVLAEPPLFCWGEVSLNPPAAAPGARPDEGGFRPVAVDTHGRPTAVAVGGAGSQGHGCALNDDGSVYCWGANRFGQLGYGNTDAIVNQHELDAAGPVDLGGPATQVVAGRYHSCALLTSGKVVCWGRNRAGQLGVGNILNQGARDVPAVTGAVRLDDEVIQIAAGRRHTCAVVASGQVFCWGLNDRRQLGYDHTNNVGDDETPQAAGPVELGGKARQVAAGDDHTCALLESGAVRCWGANDDGQLGHPHPVAGQSTPAEMGDVELGAKAVAIVAGARHTCAITPTHRVICWGRNASGQLGYGHTDAVGDDETPADAGFVPVLDH